MTGKEIIRKIMEDKNIKNCDMAYGLNITQATLWDRLNPAKSNNMTVAKLNSMLRYLGYDLVIVPHGKTAKMTEAYVVEDSETK